MPHDVTKVVLGQIPSSFKTIDNRAGTIAAGKIVRLKLDDTISIALADGSPLGISVGRDMSDIARTAVCRRGSDIPLMLTDSFTPVKGAQVHISDTTGLGIAAGAGATGVNAVYKSGLLVGIDEDGDEVDCAYIDFPGGL